MSGREEEGKIERGKYVSHKRNGCARPQSLSGMHMTHNLNHDPLGRLDGHSKGSPTRGG